MPEAELAAVLTVAWEGGYMGALGFRQLTRDGEGPYLHPEGECDTPSCTCHSRAP